MGNEDVQKILTASGVTNATGSLSVANIMAFIIFGVVGFVACMYGKKEKQYKTLVIGLVISIYPYFVASNTFLMYLIGIILTILLFVWHD